MDSVFINGWTKESVVNHIKRNFKGKAFSMEHNLCYYKMEDGRKCAVGLFLPEGHKAQESTNTVSDILRTYPDLKSLMPLPAYELGRLQRVHDMGHADTAFDDNRSTEQILNDMIAYVESLN